MNHVPDNKVHVGKHTRGMSILPSDTYIHLINQLRSKFPELHRHQERFSVNFRDEDGDMLSMQDEGDFEAAVDVARYVVIFLLLIRVRLRGNVGKWSDE
jgi:hypothetical protein